MGATGHWRHRACMLLALAPALLQSQPVYRCGNSYGQTPCTDAIVVEVQDSRTAAQKAQTDAATVQAARQAEHMERDRLATERRAIAATAQPAQGPRKRPTADARATAPSARSTAAKSAAPTKPKAGAADYFTASARSDDAKKKAAAASPRD